MKRVFTGENKIGDIVSVFPKASDIFKKYQIDFCCGGNRPLLEAIKEQNLNEEEVIEDINKTYEKVMAAERTDVDWSKESCSRLIDHIVNVHHAYLNAELPGLSELTAKILRAHGPHHGVELTKVHKLFSSLRTELETHLIKEEEIEFPLIKEYEEAPSEELYNKAIKVIRELEAEHEGAGDILKELRKVTNDYELPKDACPTYELTFNKLKELESDLFQHIHLENNILFPGFEKKIRY